MTRRSAGLRSSAPNCFYPEHAPIKEAVYQSTTKSMPSLPSLAEAWQKQSNYLKLANEDRLSRSDSFMKQAREESSQLSNYRTSQRVSIEKARKQEKSDRVQRLRATAKEREKRWVEKLGDHPFSRDLWKEDVKVYDLNQARNAADQKRRRMTEQRDIEDRGNQIKKKCSEVDELDELRKERKKLLENYKILKTRLDIEKKQARMGGQSVQLPASSQGTTDPDTTLRDSSFFVSPTRHGAVTCRPKSEEKVVAEGEVDPKSVCPLEESAGEYYTKWSPEKSQEEALGDKDGVDANKDAGDNNCDEATDPLAEKTDEVAVVA